MHTFNHLEISHPIAFFDLETTGLLSPDARIVEWSVLRFEPGGNYHFSTSLCNPGIPIPEQASKIHGYYDAHVSGLQPFVEQADKMLSMMDGCYLSGFNILKFDIPFLNNELRAMGRSNAEVKSDSVVDVMRLFHGFFPRFNGRRTLSAAYELYCGQIHDSAHGAASDTLASAKVLDEMVMRHNLPKNLEELAKKWG